VILTFYSYKGGTGRTLALANIAALLASRGKRVLAVDFDLEAPGLWRYFGEYHKELPRQVGLIDLLVDARKTAHPLNIDWRNYVTQVKLSPESAEPFEVSVMTSGRQDELYAHKVLTFNWDEFFAASQGSDFFEQLRSQWNKAYDFVFIDSRTGITDSGGICTITLPDVIVPVFSANMQNLEGLVDVIARAQRQRMTLPEDRTAAAVLPILSRFDSRFELELADRWLNLSAEALQDFYSVWLPEVPRTDLVRRVKLMLRRTSLPYVPYYSFGEELPAFAASSSGFDSLGYALNVVSRFIESSLTNFDAVTGASPPSGQPLPVIISDENEGEASSVGAQVKEPESVTGHQADGQITILGAPGSGKTTFLAALPVALGRMSADLNDQQWGVVGADKASIDALLDMTKSLTSDHRFPAATALSVERYRWLLRGRAPQMVARRFRWRRRQESRAFNLAIDIADPSGELASRSQVNKPARGDLVDNLSRSRGLILLFDPDSEYRQGNTLTNIVNVLAELHGREFGSSAGGREVLPHQVAVCVSKFDDDRVIGSAERLGLIKFDPDSEGRVPYVPDSHAREFFAHLYKAVTREDPELIMSTLEGLFGEGRVKYFVISAIGFYVDHRSNTYNPSDRQNVVGDKRIQVVRPINVAEPFIWLGRHLGGSSDG
jgi:MinD-like ATPase involved in chromosome partitioning or flagellar assembly